MQHDGDKKRIQSDAGQQERPFGKTRQDRDGRRGGENDHSRIQRYRRTQGEAREGLTVLVAGLSKGLSFGENDGNSQILEGGDIEEAGVLIVLDVFGARCVIAMGEIGAGGITGTAGQRQLCYQSWSRCHMCTRFHWFSVQWGHSLRLRGPYLIPALLLHQEES